MHFITRRPDPPVLLWLTLIALAALLAPHALAQAVCIPDAAGVPALGGHPNWYDDSLAPPEYWNELDDPRWRGSYLATFGGMAASEHVIFRALRDDTGTADEALYLSWSVKADPTIDNDIDNVWVGFSQSGASPDLVFNIWPFHDSAADKTTQLPHLVKAWQRNALGVLEEQPAPPDWLLDVGPPKSDTRIWLDLLDAGPDGEWAVQMRVPVKAGFDNGVDLADSFKMWFQVQVKTPDVCSGGAHDGEEIPTVVSALDCVTGGGVPISGLVYYTYPDGLDDNMVKAQTDSSNWADFRKDLAPTDAGCIQGVSLTASDVGVASAANCADPSFTLSSSIDLLTSTGSPQTNTFCARPLNETGASIMAGDLTATFRIANWGTGADWNDVADPVNNLWTPINPVTPATGPAIPDGPGDDKGALTFDLALTLNDPTSDFDVCDYEFAIPADRPAECSGTPDKLRHQCMLVELDGAPGLKISTSSVYRNMNFVDASVFRRVAEVSVYGLAPRPVPEPERPVFLYVKTHNMPASVGGDGGGGGDRPVGDRPDDDPVLFRRGGDERFSVPPNDGDGDGEPRPVPPLEKTPYEQLRDSMPTYVVHAYHDTGRTTTFEGKTYNVLRPQTSFGYFVRHEGDLEGWRHELTGAVEVIPNYYLISVPEGGARRIVTTIEAIERAPWSFSIHAGGNRPQGSLSNVADPGLSLGFDIAYAFDRNLELELYLGYDEFDGTGSPDLDVTHLAVDLRWYLGGGSLRPFVLGGGGVYEVDPGSTELGVLAGAGLQLPVQPNLDLEAELRYHKVFANPDDLEWFALHGGLRFHF